MKKAKIFLSIMAFTQMINAVLSIDFNNLAWEVNRGDYKLFVFASFTLAITVLSILKENKE
jgi:hypothetical protein